MPQKDIEKLLGGYATNTLTDQERKTLFDAALTNQALFDALADEQALKELLDDPRSRRHLLEALGAMDAKEPHRSWGQEIHTWVRRPSSWALAGGVAVAVLAVTLVLREGGPPTLQPDQRTASLPPTASESPPALPPITGAPSPQKKPETTAGDKLQSIEAPESKADRLPAEKDAGRMARQPSSSPPQGESAAGASALRKEQPLAQRFNARPPEKGRARELFYGTTMPGKRAEKEPEAQDEPTRATRSEKTTGAKERAKVGAEGAPGAGPPSTMREAAPMAPPPVTPLGLRYSILRGGAEEKAGESARLTVEANDTGYLYVLGKDAGGAWTMLFPGTETGEEAARVEKRRRYIIPPTGAFTLAGPSGDNRLLLVFSRQPRADLREAPESGLFADLRSGKKNAQTEALPGRARKQAETRALLMEEVEEQTSTGGSEIGVYVVDPSPDPSSSLMVDIPFSPR